MASPNWRSVRSPRPGPFSVSKRKRNSPRPPSASLLSEYLPLLAAVAPVFLQIVLGWLIRRIGWLTEEADASLLRVIVNLLYPCLILDTILGNPALEKAGNVLLAPIAGFFTVVLGYAL